MKHKEVHNYRVRQKPNNMRIIKKIIAALQVGLQIWIPAYLLFFTVSQPLPAWADKFMDAAKQGQAAGLNMLPDSSSLASQNPDGSMNFKWKGHTTTINPQDLFKDQKNTSDPHADMMNGNNAAVVNGANNEVSAMSGSSSSTGQAYQMMLHSAGGHAHVDMSHDPVWSQTDDQLTKILTGYYKDLSDCKVVTTTTTTTTTKHIPDYKTCERIHFPGNTCKCRHDYTVELLGYYMVGVGGWSPGSISISVDLKTGRITNCGGGSGCGIVVYGGNVPADACDNPTDGINKAVSYYQPYAGASISQYPNCANNFQVSFFIWHSSKNPEYIQSGPLIIGMYHVVDKGWTCDPGCEVLLDNPDGDSFIKPESFACTLGTNDSCEFFSGSRFCQGDLTSKDPFSSKGISNLCQEVTVTLDNNFNTGDMNCWTDPNGVKHCPPNPGDLKDTCGTLEDDPTCSFIRQRCIEGAEDPDSGICYAWDVVYDCGTNSTTDDPTTHISYICDGLLKCMGEGCIDGQYDPNNTDFSKAAALLQALQYAGNDADCSGSDVRGQGCTIFNGTEYECKKALGGWVDCCVQPEGVSFVNYIKLLVDSYSIMSANWDLTNVIPGLKNPFSGAWSELTDFTDDITASLSKTFSSAWDSLTGSETAVTSAYPQMAETLTQKLMQSAYNLLQEISPDLADSIFEFVPGEMGVLQLTEGMQMVLSAVAFIMWVYTIYQVLDILVHIIWACEKSEFELGAKRQMKVCHYIGSKCNSSVMSVCIEKREVYCCYNSPLARIFQEQVRKQIDGWGSAKNPNCKGLLPSELDGVNWDEVDLSEWLAILQVSGRYPTQRDLSIDGLTGSGSQFNFSNTSSPRLDAATRTQERINESGEDLEQLRIQGGLNLFHEGGH